MDLPLRTLKIPRDHLVAEMAAFPLGTEAAFRNGVVALDPLLDSDTLLNSTESKPTRALWRQAEVDLTRRFPSIALEDLTNLRDWVWFEHPAPFYDDKRMLSHSRRSPVSLRRYLSRVNSIWRGEAATRRGEDPPPLDGPQLRRRDRWFRFALPRELLALPSAEEGSHAPPVPPGLERELASEGFSENHLHAGAGTDFGLLWAATARTAAVKPPKREGFVAPGAEFDEGHFLADWLVRAMILRYMLAGFLYGPVNDGLATYARDVVLEKLRRIGPNRLGLLLEHAVGELLAGELAPTDLYLEMVGLYQHLINARSSRKFKTRSEVMAGDPVAAFFRSFETPDEEFHHAAWRYLCRIESDEQDDDELFRRLYWQLVRLQIIFYRHTVQRPMTPGLMWMLRTYKHPKPLKEILSWSIRVRESGRTSGIHQGLRALEVRTSPKKSVAGNRKRLEDLRSYALDQSQGDSDQRQSDHCEVGLVFHFVKDRGGGCMEGNPSAFWEKTEANPDTWDSSGRTPPIPGFRYSKFYRKNRTQALAIGELLLRHPWTLEYLRGLDFCTDEQGVPTWVFVPFFDYIRAAGQRASRYLKSLNVDVPPLRFTIHAGEDFVYLTTGLRRIDEALRYLGLGEGDRLGHAMTLGIDPERWSRHSGPLQISREELLFDLLWERACALEGILDSPSNRLTSVENKIRKHARFIFGDSRGKAKNSNSKIDDSRDVPEDLLWNLDDLAQFVEQLHRGRSLEAQGFPYDSPPFGRRPRERADRLLHAFLTDPRVFRRGRELVELDPVNEFEAISALQTMMRRKIGRLGVTVEVNPSSNLLIGNLGSMESHPIFRLAPLPNSEAPGDQAAVSVCLGSDNPIIFACNLPEEFALLHDTLLSLGLSNGETLEWLRQVMRAGLRSRFTWQSVVEVPRDHCFDLGRGLDLIP